MDSQNPTEVPPASPAPPVGVPPVVEIVPPQTEPQQTPPSGKFYLSPKIMLIILAILIIAVVGSGIYLSQSYQPKPTPTPTPTVASKPTPTPDPTVDWKTYENSELHYSFKYPPDWTLAPQINNECAPSVLLIPPNRTMSKCNYDGSGDMIQIGTILPPGNSILTTVMTYQTDFNLKKEDVYLDSKKGVRLSGTGTTTNINARPDPNDAHKMSVYLIQAGDKIFFHSYDLSTRSVDYSQDFEKIISTFKFTELGPTPTCQPRPACLDATPRCLIPETPDMCPAKNSTGSGLTKFRE